MRTPLLVWPLGPWPGCGKRSGSPQLILFLALACRYGTAMRVVSLPMASVAATVWSPIPRPALLDTRCCAAHSTHDAVLSLLSSASPLVVVRSRPSW